MPTFSNAKVCLRGSLRSVQFIPYTGAVDQPRPQFPHSRPKTAVGGVFLQPQKDAKLNGEESLFPFRNGGVVARIDLHEVDEVGHSP